MHVNAYKVVKLILILTFAYVSITAFNGGINLLLDPTGATMKIDKFIEFLPFGKDFFIYGVMLIVFNGIGQLICLMLLLFNNNRGGVIAGMSAGILLIWVTVQLFSIGWFKHSVLYLIIGIFELILSLIFCKILKNYSNKQNEKNS